VDIITGFIDPNAPDEIAAPVNPKLASSSASAEEESEDEEADSGSEEEETLETGPDPEEAARRFQSIAKLHQQVLKLMAEDKTGKDPKSVKLRKKLAA